MFKSASTYRQALQVMHALVRCLHISAFCLHTAHAGWYSRTTNPETGKTSIRVGSRFFPIVRLQTEGDRTSGGGGEQRSSNGEGGSSSPGGLESLRVGPFGNLVSIDDGEDRNPDIGVLGGWGG
mgnify:CR=1 FL=1